MKVTALTLHGINTIDKAPMNYTHSKDLRIMEKQNGEWKIVTVAALWDYKNIIPKISFNNRYIKIFLTFKKITNMETSVQQQQELSLKNTCVQFMFAYQQKNLEKMLSFCNLKGMIEFIPLGEAGKGKIGELGRAIWGGLIECFPDIDNTLDAAVAEDDTQFVAR